MTRWRFRLGNLLLLLLANIAGAEEGPPWVDLLEFVDTKRDGVVGDWQKTSAGLVAPAMAGARIQSP